MEFYRISYGQPGGDILAIFLKFLYNEAIGGVFDLNGKVIVGLSGGVDSSVTAYLLKKQGYDVTGVNVHMFDHTASETSAEDAGKVADYLGIPFVTRDLSDIFETEVIRYFTDAYRKGLTPNPCVVCNHTVKWLGLLESCRDMGAVRLATGHYARIRKQPDGRYAVERAVSAAKDQSYVLYRLTQEQLKSTIMPLGDYEKEEIRYIAEKAGIPVADKPDSQEICFIPDNDYAGFIERRTGKSYSQEGNFVTADGRVLGKHKGIIHYTIGQRKGLNLAMGYPVFVTQIRPDTNEVVIGSNEDVFTEKVLFQDAVFMGSTDFSAEGRLWGRIRYGHKGHWCRVNALGGGLYEAEFEEPVRAATPGQSIVLYHGDAIAGGGYITGHL